MKTKLFSKQGSGADVLSKCLRASFFPVSVSILLIACSHTDRIDIIEAKCNSCHSSDIVYKTKRSDTEWDILLTGMKTRGLRLTPAEEKQVSDALHNKLGNGK